MGKIIDVIQATYASKDDISTRPTISFEFFPAKTQDGVFNLLNRVEEMGFSLQPTFVTLTWRSAFKDEQLWLRIGQHIQKEFQLDVLMHLTCHLPKEKLKEILHKAKEAGIRNILALRGDPPIGADKWKPIPNGLNNAVDLIKLIREEHGDYFCIACAGYAEVHTESWNHPDLPPSKEAKLLDLERLKMKQDAGADFIITQFFFDVENMIQWIKECRTNGILIPILPGYLPIQNYHSFCKFTSWCKTRVPQDVLDALEKIKNDDAEVKKYGTQLAIQTCRLLLDAGIKSLHFYTMNLASTVTKVLEGLELIPSKKILPWQNTSLRRSSTNFSNKEEQIRPIFWSNRQASYIARTAEWDEFPNGRWGDRTSPAYGDLSEYYLAFKRPKMNRQDLWGRPTTQKDVWQIFVNFIQGKIKQLPWCEQALSLESLIIKENLKWINANGFLTINSQPRVNAAPSNDPSVGWGASHGFVFQKAYVEFFVCPSLMENILEVIKEYPSLSFHALNLEGKEYRNTPQHSVTAVTWGVFPGQEIIQPTVVDSDSFEAWKNEAFELWQAQWASAYEPDSISHQIIQEIYDSYFLVNIVDNDYTNGKLCTLASMVMHELIFVIYLEESDIFAIFTRIITNQMSKKDLRDRVLILEKTNEKLQETVVQLKNLQEETSNELQQLHQQIAKEKEEKNTLKLQLRQLQARIALSSI
jgi:methylenetetrahydrofolate reductase (NADPH)